MCLVVCVSGNSIPSNLVMEMHIYPGTAGVLPGTMISADLFSRLFKIF